VLQHSTVAWRAIIYPCKDLPLAIAVCGLTRCIVSRGNHGWYSCAFITIMPQA